MTSLGHTLVGVSIGMLCMPAMEKARHRIIFMVGMIAIASLPDWPIPGWGHYRLDISHSIIVNGAAMLGIVVGLRRLAGPTFRQYRKVVVGAMTAWMSHFVLDAFYADSSLAIFWPLNNASVTVPIPWLKTMPHAPPPFDRQILQIFMFEALTFLPLLFLVAALRMRGRAPRPRFNHKL